MAAEENKALVKRYFEEVVNRRNLDAIDELVSEEGGGTCGGLAAFRGRRGFRQNAQQVLDAFPDFRVDIEELVAEGDTVVVRWTGRGTQEGPFMGVPPTRKVVPVSVVEIHHIKDGKIASIWALPDTLDLLQNLNVLKAPLQSSTQFLG